MKSQECKPYPGIKYNMLYHNPCQLFQVTANSIALKKRAGDRVTYPRNTKARIFLRVEVRWYDVRDGVRGGYGSAGNEFQKHFNNLA